MPYNAKNTDYSVTTFQPNSQPKSKTRRGRVIVYFTKTISNQLTFKDFFAKCTLNENAVFTTGSICGYKVEEIENPLTKKVRMLDKLVDELTKGKTLEKILR